MSPASPVVLKAVQAGLRLDETEILSHLDFDLRAGEWTFLLGPPGCGKTMQLRLAAGALAPTSGAIERAGAAALAAYDTPFDDRKSARDIVAEAMAGRADAQARAAELLGALGLETYLNHEPFRLSRGHRARLAIAQAIAARPALLCLDDPFSPMDRLARAKTADVLQQAVDDWGLAILMVSNDAPDALRYADRILLMSSGPAARIAAILVHDPMPEAPDDELESCAIYGKVEAALWGRDIA